MHALLMPAYDLGGSQSRLDESKLGIRLHIQPTMGPFVAPFACKSRLFVHFHFHFHFEQLSKIRAEMEMETDR